MRQTIWLLTITVALAAAAPALAHEEGVGGEHVVPALSVRGEARVQAAPDEATVRLGVVAQAATAREAQEEVNRISGAILAAIGRLGVPRERIQTAEIQLFPVYAPEPPQVQGGMPREPRIVGYRSTNVVSVRLLEMDQIGPVVDAGLAAGANQVEGVSFGLRDELAARRQALTAAAAAARQKAQTLAAALDVQLGELLEVVEGGAQVVVPRFAAARMASESLAMDTATQVLPGQITVEAVVTVTYRIAGAAAARP